MMAIALNPYLNFKEQTKAAMEFYHSVFGGKLNLNTFKDYHAAQDPSEEALIMHSVLEGDNGVTFMAADTPNRMEYKAGSNFSMSLSGQADDETVLKGYFEKLSQGGQVTMPLEKAIWGDTFGMLVDRFGITWLVNIAAAK